MEKVRATAPWNKFVNIVSHEFNGIGEVAADIRLDAPIEVYTLSGVKVADSLETLPTGVYVVRQGAKSRKMAVK